MTRRDFRLSFRENLLRPLSNFRSLHVSSDNCSTPDVSEQMYSKKSFNMENFSCLLEPLYTKLFSNSQSDFLSFFDVSVKAALDDSCPKKSKRRLGFPYYYFSHSIHLANKLRTLRRKKFSILSCMTRLESDFITSVVLDKEVLFQNLSCAFKFLNQFKKSPINANNLHWGRKQAVCDVSISDFFNKNYASVFR